uniref:Uncharacterized protein n=1 Tax=Glossina brevipalpis TaxID=37001 RepID=A0A1A9X5C6_9MUSC
MKSKTSCVSTAACLTILTTNLTTCLLIPLTYDKCLITVKRIYIINNLLSIRITYLSSWRLLLQVISCNFFLSTMEIFVSGLPSFPSSGSYTNYEQQYLGTYHHYEQLNQT